VKAYTKRGREWEPKTLRQAIRDMHPDLVAHLAEFCRAGVTTFAATDRETCVNIGRHQVWLELNGFLGLSGEEIEQIYAGRGYQLTNEDENSE
jgi:hypothetical protein